MAARKAAPIGSIKWVDLTVPYAEEVRDFYREVVGWRWTGLDMGGYEDFCMNLPAGGKTVAGICHARGTNADLPPAWLVYITVADVDRSAARCVSLGGAVLVGPKELGGMGRVCVIRDPAGAPAALFEPASPATSRRSREPARRGSGAPGRRRSRAARTRRRR
jgi:predicted enzyme related to lactoylglutathione lyase